MQTQHPRAHTPNHILHQFLCSRPLLPCPNHLRARQLGTQPIYSRVCCEYFNKQILNLVTLLTHYLLRKPHKILPTPAPTLCLLVDPGTSLCGPACLPGLLFHNAYVYCSVTFPDRPTRLDFLASLVFSSSFQRNTYLCIFILSLHLDYKPHVAKSHVLFLVPHLGEMPIYLWNKCINNTLRLFCHLGLMTLRF